MSRKASHQEALTLVRHLAAPRLSLTLIDSCARCELPLAPCSRARVVLLLEGQQEGRPPLPCHAPHGDLPWSCCLQAWEGLSAELSKDMSRLWRRNLGRDDRIIADTGREARHPFLDEQFIETLLGLPLPLIADLRLPPGTGDKQLLRMALLRYSIPTDHPHYCITRCMPLAHTQMKGAELAHRLA